MKGKDHIRKGTFSIANGREVKKAGLQRSLLGLVGRESFSGSREPVRTASCSIRYNDYSCFYL